LSGILFICKENCWVLFQYESPNHSLLLGVKSHIYFYSYSRHFYEQLTHENNVSRSDQFKLLYNI